VQPQADDSPERLSDSQLADEISRLKGWQDEQQAGSPVLGSGQTPQKRNERLHRRAALEREYQRRLTFMKLGDDPRSFAEQVQDPVRQADAGDGEQRRAEQAQQVRRGHIRDLLGHWLEINAPELDAYLIDAPTIELEQLVAGLDSARTGDHELQSFILVLRMRVAGVVDGTLPARPSAARPEHRLRLASAVRERLLEMGAIRPAPTTPAVIVEDEQTRQLRLAIRAELEVSAEGDVQERVAKRLGFSRTHLAGRLPQGLYKRVLEDERERLDRT
jgi:hypothetical protein